MWQTPDVKIRSPKLKLTSELSPGELFYHREAGAGVLCLAASAGKAEDGHDLRIVPLHYPQAPDSIGVPIYERTFSGTALLVDYGVAEVDPLSLATHGPQAILSDGITLFLPLNNSRGFRNGLLDIEKGIIVDYSANLSAFARWKIVDAEDRDIIIWSSGGDGNE